MFCFSLRLLPNRACRLLLIVSAVLFFSAALRATPRAQRPRGGQDEEHPLFADFKGVRIGMSADEARKKLGSPKDKGDEIDLYVFNDTQAVQIFYDKAKTIMAISIDFLEGGANAPPPKDVLGGEADARPDGSLYKMVRYPKAGYWVSYSKTAGNSPTVTITMQKIEH